MRKEVMVMIMLIAGAIFILGGVTIIAVSCCTASGKADKAAEKFNKEDGK